MRVNQRTRHGSVSVGPVGLMLLGLFVGPLYLMGYLLAGLVRLVAWGVREYTASRTRAANPVATPNRHP